MCFFFSFLFLFSVGLAYLSLTIPPHIQHTSNREADSHGVLEKRGRIRIISITIEARVKAGKISHSRGKHVIRGKTRPLVKTKMSARNKHRVEQNWVSSTGSPDVISNGHCHFSICGTCTLLEAEEPERLPEETSEATYRHRWNCVVQYAVSSLPRLVVFPPANLTARAKHPIWCSD